MGTIWYVNLLQTAQRTGSVIHRQIYALHYAPYLKAHFQISTQNYASNNVRSSQTSNISLTQLYDGA